MGHSSSTALPVPEISNLHFVTKRHTIRLHINHYGSPLKRNSHIRSIFAPWSPHVLEMSLDRLVLVMQRVPQQIKETLIDLVLEFKSDGSHA